MQSLNGEPTSPTKKRNSLTVEDFTLRHRLGKGAYGDVFLVAKKSDGKVYAMKQIQKRKLAKEEKEYQAMVEKQLLTTMQHQGIVRLRYCFQDKTSLYFIQEYCEGGEFINFIKLNIDKLDETVRVFYIAEIVNLLQYLHSNGITHRDLKPENLMLDKKGHLRLIDFGTAEITNCTLLKPQFKEHILNLKKKSDQLIKANEQKEQELSEQDLTLKKRRSTFVGTVYYISPQLLEENYCPPSADLWALGCILYQLYYLQTPFKDNYQFAVFQKIKQAEVHFPKNDFISEEAIDLIKKLLVKKPEGRLGSGSTEELSYKQLKAHPYFKGIDIDNIFNSPVPFIADLQEPEKTEEERKESEENKQKLALRREELEENLKNKGLQIIKCDILQEKSFVYYSFVLLALCKGREIWLFTQDEEEWKQVKVGEGQVTKLFSQNKFEVFGQKTYHFRSNMAQQWVNALQEHV